MYSPAGRGSTPALWIFASPLSGEKRKLIRSSRLDPEIECISPLIDFRADIGP